ncbi:MAG: beta-propeller fold lactonase family protein [Verrucomicrobia bacterium]|nr:beta-propeller fold lactonase family protein [Verrucomicrobiota bacterium]
MKLSLLLLVAMTLLASTPPGAARDPLVFVSSFVPGEAGAIHAYSLDPEAGTLTALARTTGISSPFYLALSPDGRFLYATSAVTFGGKEPESVVAYALDGRSGELTELNRQSTRGTASCYVATDATAKTLLVANYTSGDVASLPIRDDGTLGEAVSYAKHEGTGGNPEVQKGPHAHSFVVSPDNRFAFAADLGIDTIMAYRLDAATATLSKGVSVSIC